MQVDDASLRAVHRACRSDDLPSPVHLSLIHACTTYQDTESFHLASLRFFCYLSLNLSCRFHKYAVAKLLVDNYAYSGYPERLC